jgi:hypothetical protein
MLFIVFFNPADGQVKVYKAVYDRYPDPITLYYINENPYHRAKEIHYYKRENLEIKKAQSTVDTDSSYRKKYLIAIRGKDPELSLFKDHKLVYASYPEWIKRFNINHWQDRTKSWYVYEEGE